jgi:4-amino-4-deoxy-L-arabinose transferase-like glycosyltransferase
MLPFFWIGCLAVYWWGCLQFSRAVAVIAVFLFSFTPPVLAHAGFTTTDMALTGFFALAFVAGLAWIERPTPLRAAGFGVATALMVLSKFSCMAFFPAVVALALAGYWLAERPSPSALFQAAKLRLPTFALAVAVSLVVIWAGYRFSFGSVSPGGMSVPAPEFFKGIQEVRSHLDRGHEGYLLGEIRNTGFWDFYLVAIAVKTPIGFLALLAIGLVLVFRRYPLARCLWLPLMLALGVLLVGIFSTVNIGVRHVLPVYVGFSLLAAVAVVKLWEAGRAKPWIRAVLGALLLWFAGSSLLSHPDYLPYFNEVTLFTAPENILVDSDLDWGQDLKRLSTRLRKLGATSVTLNNFDYADLEKEHGFPHINGMSPATPFSGYNALGFTLWKEFRVATWPDRYPPTERVGKGMLLWYFQPETRK